MSEEFRPTHTIRFTFASGVYGEADVCLVADENGDGPAYRKPEWGTGASLWERRGGQWLNRGSTTINGEPFQLDARYAAKPTSFEPTSSADELMAQLQAIEQMKQMMRTRPAVDRELVIDEHARRQVQRLEGSWRCFNGSGWPPVIDIRLSVVDLERGIVRNEVEAMGQRSAREIKIYEVTGEALKVQTLDSQEISEWRFLSEATIQMGVAPNETVLVFNRQ